MSGRTLALLLAATLALGAWLAALDPPGGMIAFELAGSGERASAQITTWSALARERTMLALGLDFAFLLLYPASLAQLCERALRSAPAAFRDAGAACARWVWLAAPLDAIENGALLHQLAHGGSDLAARVALACALPKFALVLAAGAFLLCALGARLLPRAANLATGAPQTIRLEEWTNELASNLEDRLYAFNVAATGIADGRGLALVARDPAGRAVAAALGTTWGGTCELKQVWVDVALRGSGLGRELMLRAIAEAEARGCSQLLLATHAFQAPGFYAKLGFRELFRLDDYPRGHGEIWLLRALTPRG